MLGSGPQIMAGQVLKPIGESFNEVNPPVRQSDAIEVAILDDQRAVPFRDIPVNYANDDFRKK